MKIETKTSLGALILTLLSMLCLCLIAFSNQMTNPETIIITVAVVGAAGVAAVTVIAAVTAIAAVTVIAVAIATDSATVFVAIGASLVIIFSTWNKNKKRFELKSAILLWLIFTAPLFLVIPLSKYHNLNQLEKDKRVVEIIQVNTIENGVEIILPNDYSSDNSYLKSNFSLGWNKGKMQEWKKTVILCQEGEKQWFKVKLPFPEERNDITKLSLFFDHVWWDYDTTKEILLEQP